MKSKAQVIAGDSPRHPFRATLLQHAPRGEVQRRRWAISLTTVREFLMAYCACFLAVSLFIA